MHHLYAEASFRSGRYESVMAAKSPASMPERRDKTKQKQKEGKRNNKNITKTGHSPEKETLGDRGLPVGPPIGKGVRKQE